METRRLDSKSQYKRSLEAFKAELTASTSSDRNVSVFDSNLPLDKKRMRADIDEAPGGTGTEHSDAAKDQLEQPVTDNTHALFEVETIKAVRKGEGKNKYYYKVSWKGYGPDDDTWEPRENLLCDGLLKAFESSEEGKRMFAECQKPASASTKRGSAATSSKNSSRPAARGQTVRSSRKGMFYPTVADYGKTGPSSKPALSSVRPLMVRTKPAQKSVKMVSAQNHFVMQDQQNNEWCDIALFGHDSAVANGIRCHKVILASVSPHLREAFQSEGFTDSGAKEYRINQINHATLQSIVDFIYSNTLQLAGEDIDKRLKCMLVGADYLLMPELVRLCGKGLADPAYLKSDCAISSWLFARKYRCKVLEDAALQTTAQNVSGVALQDDYLNLAATDAKVLLAAVSAKAEADLVGEAAVAWLGYKTAERTADCDEIMRQISLSDLTAAALRRVGEKSFLSAQVLWAVRHALVMRAEIDDLS